MDFHTETRHGRSSTVTGTRTRGATVTRYVTERTGFSARVDAGRHVLGVVVGALLRAWRATAQTVSAAGWLLATVAAIGVIAAIRWGWIEAWVMGIASLALLMLCVPFLLGRQTYTVSFELDKDRVVAGSDVTASLSVTNRARRLTLPAVLDVPIGAGLVEAHIPLLRGGAEHREQLTIAASRRGVITVGPMTVGRGDPLGIMRSEHTWAGSQDIYVHPVTISVPSTSAGLMHDLEGAATKTIVDSDLSFHAIREYMPGDSRRHVHWKSTAKTGKLMVRQYEETRRSMVAIVIDLDQSQYSSEDEFEIAVSAAASLALQAVREGREIVITASAHIPKHALGKVHSIRTLPTVSPRATLDGMSTIESGDDVMPLGQVSQMTSQESLKLSLVFVVTGSLNPVSSVRKAAVVFPADVDVIAVRCEPGAEPSFRTAREVRVMTIGMLHDLGHMLVRAQV